MYDLKITLTCHVQIAQMVRALAPDTKEMNSQVQIHLGSLKTIFAKSGQIWIYELKLIIITIIRKLYHK